MRSRSLRVSLGRRLSRDRSLGTVSRTIETRFGEARETLTLRAVPCFNAEFVYDSQRCYYHDKRVYGRVICFRSFRRVYLWLRGAKQIVIRLFAWVGL